MTPDPDRDVLDGHGRRRLDVRGRDHEVVRVLGATHVVAHVVGDRGLCPDPVVHLADRAGEARQLGTRRTGERTLEQVCGAWSGEEGDEISHGDIRSGRGPRR